MISEIFRIDILDYWGFCLLGMHSVAMLIKGYIKSLVKFLVLTFWIIVLFSFLYAVCCSDDEKFCKMINEMFSIDMLDYCLVFCVCTLLLW